MDIAEYVHRRKRRYMAQILEDFEATCEAHLPQGAAQNFKGTIRRKLHAFAIDISEVTTLKPGEEVNGVAIDLRDRVWADTPPTAQRSD
jgi:hypothetical protein